MDGLVQRMGKDRLSKQAMAWYPTELKKEKADQKQFGWIQFVEWMGYLQKRIGGI